MKLKTARALPNGLMKPGCDAVQRAYIALRDLIPDGVERRGDMFPVFRSTFRQASPSAATRDTRVRRQTTSIARTSSAETTNTRGALDAGGVAGGLAVPLKQPATADQVAEIIVGLSTIGSACNTLRAAGMCASIAGNRICVDETLFVQYLGSGRDAVDGGHPAWLIFASPSEPPTLVSAGRD